MPNYDSRHVTVTWPSPSAIAKGDVVYQGQRFPAYFTARLSHPDWSVDVEVTVHVDPERGPIPTGLGAVVQPEGEIESYRTQQTRLASTMDERMLMQELLTQALKESIFWRLLDEVETVRDEPGAAEKKAELVARAKAAGDDALTRGFAAAKPRRRRLVTREFLGQVAQTYREALDSGEPPTIAVASAFSVSHSNASKYVKKARDAGALGPADSTRPGERGKP